MVLPDCVHGPAMQLAGGCLQLSGTSYLTHTACPSARPDATALPPFELAGAGNKQAWHHIVHYAHFTVTVLAYLDMTRYPGLRPGLLLGQICCGPFSPSCSFSAV
jgi:hypothetical protein